MAKEMKILLAPIFSAPKEGEPIDGFLKKMMCKIVYHGEFWHRIGQS